MCGPILCAQFSQLRVDSDHGENVLGYISMVIVNDNRISCMGM